MASDITLLQSFVDGQGAGANTYDEYAADLDTNFALIQTTINAINAELSAIGGNNAPLVLDLLTSASSPAVSTGIVDATSFQPVAFLSGDTQIQIPGGVALTALGRIEIPATSLFTGTGTSGTRWFAVRENGTITQETSAGQGVMDLYSVTWTGAVFTTASLSRLELILPAGHDFQNQKTQADYGQGTDAAIPPFTYDRIADRIEDITRIMGGLLTSADADQGALHPMAFGGSVGTPGLILGDGTTHDTTTGFYRAAANQLGVSVNATLAMLYAETVADQPQSMMRPGTSLATPPLTFNGDGDSGVGWISADLWRLIAGNIEVLRISEVGSNPQALTPLGAVGAPSLGFIGDENTGQYSPGGDRIAWATNGIQAMELNANQQRISPTQGRASATESTFSLANNAITAVNLTTAEQYDVGTYHDLVTNPDRMTVPTGHGGIFAVTAGVTFDESTSAGTPNAGDRGIEITVNGTAVRAERSPAAGAGDTQRAAAVDVLLADGDIVRVTAFQDSGGAMDVSARLTVRHAE